MDINQYDAEIRNLKLEVRSQKSEVRMKLRWLIPTNKIIYVNLRNKKIKLAI